MNRTPTKRPTAQRLRTSGLVMLMLAAGVGLVTYSLLLRSPADATKSAGLTGLATALCASYDAADENRSESAEIFQRRVHGPLHELAARVTTTDRTVAARLMEAKYETESAASQSPPGHELAAATRELAVAAQAAFSSIGVRPHPCLAEATVR